jgi:hypothetical protein
VIGVLWSEMSADELKALERSAETLKNAVRKYLTGSAVVARAWWPCDSSATFGDKYTKWEDEMRNRNRHWLAAAVVFSALTAPALARRRHKRRLHRRSRRRSCPPTPST